MMTHKISNAPKKHILELAYLEEGKIRISLSESHGQGPIAFYQETETKLEKIDAVVREIIHYLNKINTLKNPDQHLLNELQNACQLLYNELLSQEIKIKIQNTNLHNLELILDEQLVHIPWELLFDGQKFLCEVFSMGRQVRTKGSKLIQQSTQEKPKSRLNMLIIANPTEDLDIAWREGIRIYEEFQKKEDLVKIVLQACDHVDLDFVKKNIWDYDILHYAGHADYNPTHPNLSGWIFCDGRLNASDILKMAGSKRLMPRLVFGNACQSGYTEKWLKAKGTINYTHHSYGLVHAFLISGVQYYIGTFCDVPDEYGAYIGIAFYYQLLEGNTIGESLRKARESFKEKFGEKSFSWINYVLYGHPGDYLIDTRRMDTSEQAENKVAADQLKKTKVLSKKTKQEDAPAELTLRRSLFSLPQRNRWMGTTIVFLLILIFITMVIYFPRWHFRSDFFQGDPGRNLFEMAINRWRPGTIQYERDVVTFYEEGKFNEALDVCKILEGKNSKLALPHLIRGNIYLANGKLDSAETAYQKALRSANVNSIQKAHAFLGLGRIQSLKKQINTALDYYRLATEAAPENSLGYLSQALLLEEDEKYDEALDLFGKAQSFMPEDHILKSIINETRRKVELAKDQKKQERIDRLIKELSEGFESGSFELSWDGWTSRPLTIWITDFEVQGHPLQEGQERLLASGITDLMIQHTRAKLVERVLFDKLIDELKLGTSKLIDRNTMLYLGRILAARLIIDGRLVYSGPQVQVSLRLIETETGQITAAINEPSESSVTASILAEHIFKKLSETIEKNYPLRGMIAQVKQEDIVLNIGEMAGVTVGRQFRIIDEDVTLQVKSVKQDSSIAEIIKGEKIPEENSRVEAIP